VGVPDAIFVFDVLDNHALALPSREANNTLRPTTQ